jgi:hypothetical protein
MISHLNFKKTRFTSFSTLGIIESPLIVKDFPVSLNSIGNGGENRPKCRNIEPTSQGFDCMTGYIGYTLDRAQKSGRGGNRTHRGQCDYPPHGFEGIQEGIDASSIPSSFRMLPSLPAAGYKPLTRSCSGVHHHHLDCRRHSLYEGELH